MSRLLFATLLAFLSGRSLHATSVGVRIRFGMTDSGNRDGDGSASVFPPPGRARQFTLSMAFSRWALAFGP